MKFIFIILEYFGVFQYSGRGIYTQCLNKETPTADAIDQLIKQKEFVWLINLAHDTRSGDFEKIKVAIFTSDNQKAIDKWNIGWGTAIKILLKNS